MSPDLVIVLLLLGTAIAMFALNKPRMDAVALIMLTVLPFTGVITMGEALAGFSDSNVVLIAALFVVGDGLVRTGVARSVGDWLISKAGTSEIRLMVLLMSVVGALGAMMSSTAVTAIFIPVVLRVSQSIGAAPGRLMMPLSVAALISGMTTLVATAPNLVVNSELIRYFEKNHIDEKGFQFFSFTPFGAPLLVIGILYMLFARRWLGAKSAPAPAASNRPSMPSWIDEYKLADREYRLRVLDGSPLVGKAIKELSLRETYGANIVAIERGRDVIAPGAKTVLQGGDVLLIDWFAPKTDVKPIQERLSLEEMPLTGVYFTDRSQEIGMAEVILPPNSELLGKTVVEAKFRARYGLTVIGLRRGTVAHERGLLNDKLKFGDTLLLIGPWKAIRSLRFGEKDVVLLELPAEADNVLPVAGKAVHALLCLLLVVVLMVTGVVPNVQAALIGCLLMGALKCVDMESAYRSIDWKTIVLIVGMLPFSLALQRTGGVDLMADMLMKLIGGAGPHVVLATLFAITALLGLFISNTATAVLMAPVAITIAHDLKASPYPFAMIVALAASTAFMTPVSSPVNTLVVTPGNYTFGDFFRVGALFAVIVMIVSVILVPLLLPL